MFDRAVVAVIAGVLGATVSACSSSEGGGGTGGAAQGGSGGGATGGGGAGGSSAAGGSGGGATGGAGAGGGAQGGSGGSSTDPYDAARQTCVDKINALRATKGLTPLARWTDQEACADQQATADQQVGTGHANFGDCGESGQNECLGAGASGVAGCLDSMWAEKDQAGCSGCDACADAYTPNCPNCDFYGKTTGDVCGHYANMSAKYFSKVACGFSAAGGWVAIDFK